MTVAEAAKQAVSTRNERMALGVAKSLRRAGFQYAHMAAMVKRLGIDLAEWDELVKEGENEHC